MIAVSITVARERTVEATVADTVPVAELVPHLVDASPGEVWRLSGPLGVLRPEDSLSQSGVRPGERLTLDKDALPAPPVDDVGRLSAPVASSPAVWVAALLTATVCSLVWAPLWSPEEHVRWHPTDISDLAVGLLGGDVAGRGEALVVCAVLLLATLAAAAGSLVDRRFLPVAAVLGFGLGLQVNVLTACVFAAMSVWRHGVVRTMTVGLALAAAVNVSPGLTTLVAVVALTFSGQLAVGLAGITLPRVPATGLFAAAARESGAAGTAESSSATEAARALRLHPAIVVTCCVVILAGAVQLLPLHGEASLWTQAALLTVAVTGLSARATRPVHAVAVTVTAVLLLLWVVLQLPAPWSLLALAPVALPAVRITSPLAGRVLDVLETVAFTVAVPLLISTTGVFEVRRGIGCAGVYGRRCWYRWPCSWRPARWFRCRRSRRHRRSNAAMNRSLATSYPSTSPCPTTCPPGATWAWPWWTPGLQPPASSPTGPATGTTACCTAPR
ncbi:EsaB/YukD family protein [Corynebacterium sp. AOP40-9SA-29]|uniref:EsaB/YukD family protein n=1 Tax=Corynebacterium sp. AOP40-9SA-29 TaxID=3457677 RepID=UPI0040338D2C